MCSFLAPMTTGDCHGHRRALYRSRIRIYRDDFYYFTEVVLVSELN